MSVQRRLHPGSPAPHRWPPGSASLPAPTGSSAVTVPPGPRGDHPPPPPAEPPDRDQRIHPGHPSGLADLRTLFCVHVPHRIRSTPTAHQRLPPHNPDGPTRQLPGRARTQPESPVRSLNVNSEEDLSTHQPPPSTVLPNRTWDR